MNHHQAEISDCTIIGDTRTAALLSKHGSIDWMCIPRFDGEAVLGRLIDWDSGGSFSISLDETKAMERSYAEVSATHQTTITTSTGRPHLVEGMVATMRGTLLPQALLIRRLQCQSGDLWPDRAEASVRQPRWKRRCLRPVDSRWRPRHRAPSALARALIARRERSSLL
jgi:hypothetical protein